jgi:hypothetical protein
VIAERLRELEATTALSPLFNERTCIHEASHAIVDDDLGRRVLEVFVASDGSGVCRDAQGERSDLPLRDTVVEAMASFAAGRIGEKLKFGDARSDADVEWRPGTRPDSDEEWLQSIPRLLPNEDPQSIREAAAVKAELILRKRWDDALKVAAALEQRSRLTGAEFYALIGKRVPGTESQVMVRKATMPLMLRSATMNAATNNEVELVWTTGASVRRTSYDGPYDEVLETGPSNVRLGRLNAGAPLLNTHDSSDLSRVLGSVVPGSAKM